MGLTGWFFELCGDKQAGRIKPRTLLLAPRADMGLAPNGRSCKALPHLLLCLCEKEISQKVI